MESYEPIWSPSQFRIDQSNLTKFIQHINMQGEAIETFPELHQWSISDSKRFWLEIWQFCDVIGFQGDCIVGEAKPKWKTYVPNRDTLWFPQASVNYAENLLSYAFQKPQEIAIWFENESKEQRTLTWQQLCDQVSCVQQWLLRNGVGEGDVVAGYLPYIPESVVAMLATTSLGAIWTSTSPDFGIESVVERFGQVHPKVLFCCNGYQFNGKTYIMREKNIAVCNALSGLENFCEIQYNTQAIDDANNQSKSDFSSWSGILQNYTPKGIQYLRVNFNDPLFVLYSSGTTGKPKCIIHSVGGTVLNHLKEHQLHCDIQPDDKVFFYTTCGWMMWNWHVSALASGATLVIYDGSPTYPSYSSLWDLAENSDTTLFGASAKYLEALENEHYEPALFHQLNHLKTLCSTGSVLYPSQYDYVYQNIKQDLHLASISGGTDICGCFVLGNPISPVYRGESQYAGLGISVEVFSKQGKSLVAERGELVCTNAIPNFPVGFWNDNGERYHHAYWDKYHNVWHHGDEVVLNPRGGVTFFGRSDATLNPGGVRIGTSEIYQQVNVITGVADSIAVGKNEASSEEIILFIQTSPGTSLTTAMISGIKQTLRDKCSPRHVPKYIYEISDIPKTRSGKSVEVAVKQVVNGQPIENMAAIANPEIFDEIKSLLS